MKALHIPSRASIGLVAVAASAIASCAVFAQNDGTTMQAIQFTKFGTASELKLVKIARPKPGPGEVLVQVTAAGLNPVDWKVRNGEASRLVKQFPVIPGYDLAGKIIAVGDGVKTRKVGEQVYAMRPLENSGTYAEYAAIAENLVALKPKKTSMTETAGLPLAALTAYQALFEQGGLRPGQTVLIHGASGGVGHFAVQIAKRKGAKVIGTASARNAEFLKSLGADTVIDYRATRFENVVKNVDLVIDTIGGDTLARSYGVIRKGGRIISLIEKPDAQKAQQFGVQSGERLVVYPSGTQLTEIAQMVDADALKVNVTVFPLQDAVKATQQSETGRTRGKIVFQIGETK
jgi:NADPH:quinone reductase-like Zn-dependent oxidoreductase